MGSYKKKLFIVLLVTLLLGFFVCGSVNAVSTLDVQYTIDQPTLLKQQQEYLASIFLNKFDKLATDSQKQDLKDSIGSSDYFYIFTYVNSNSRVRINLYRFRNNIYFYNLSDYLLNTGDEYFEDVYLSYPVSGYSVSNNETGSNIRQFQLDITGNAVYSSNTTNTVFIPSVLIFYQNSTLKSYYNGIIPSADPWVMIYNGIQENTAQEEETTNEMKELNNFMKSEDVDQDAYNYPTNNPTQDPTTDGINNIFNKFYSRITNWDSSNISVYIPFANKSFTIPANASEQLLAKFSNMGLGSTLKSLISAVWFYVLARYIIKDVQKYVDGLKTGEILTKSDTNIKTEML